MSELLTRIAPTPSGYLHSGNALHLMLTQRLAHRYGARVMLRIDDLDSCRTRPEYVADVFNTLSRLGISWQSGPLDPQDFHKNWSQRHRLPLYESMLNELVAKNAVYACSCSRKNLTPDSEGHESHQCRNGKVALDTQGVAWRIRIPLEETIEFEDEMMGAVSVNLTTTIPDPVVRRRDGGPAYQIASLADDVHFGIGLIVRGEDLIGSTAVQLYMARILSLRSFEKIIFFHHVLIKGDEGQKLSKSAGSHSQANKFNIDELVRMTGSILKDFYSQ